MTNKFSSEQIRAIEIEGGGLVAAGAGSGKTAVLIEHLIRWMSNLRSFKSSNDLELLIDLKKLIVITFTVKASKEMKMRLYERIQELQSLDESNGWNNVRKHLHAVYIGTIDGFCAKLIGKNLAILPISVPFDIVSNQEWEDKIHHLYHAWQISLEDNDCFNISEVWSRKFINWLIMVLSSTPSRLLWKKIASQKLSSDTFVKENNHFLKEMLNELGWSELLKKFDKISEELIANKSKNSEKKWNQFIIELISSVRSLDVLEQFEFVNTLTKKYKGMRTPTDEEYEHIAQAIKELKNLCKIHYQALEDWRKCLNEKGEIYWNNILKLAQSLYLFIDETYGRVPGFCFADLSYYTQEILSSKILKDGGPYYLVVDELQDTSELQLEQIYILSGRNSCNLYGVGDVKQAIYGFRGGQSHVFYEFEKLVKYNKVELYDNYRSHESIVKFNNRIFLTLFEKTKSIEQIAKKMISDDVSSENNNVEVIQWDVSYDEKMPEWQQEILEYYALVDKIKFILASKNKGSIAVLFRTNAQIKKFSSLMYQEGISFRVQWKVSYEEDPLYQIFKILMLIGSAQENEKDVQSLFKTFKYYLSLVSIEEDVNHHTFFEDWRLFDAYSSFVRFINRYNIAIAFQAPFVEILKSKSKYTLKYFKEYLLWLDEIKHDESIADWNLPFNTKDENNITLQTIHASKGLQYDHVLLARISSQVGNNKRSDMALGDTNPFQMKEFTFLRNPWKTPAYYYETMQKKDINKEEALRLFYVACTRAKQTITISLATNIKSDSWGDLVLKAGKEVSNLTNKSLDEKMLSIIKQEIRLLPIFEAKIYQEWRHQYFKKTESHSSLKLLPSMSVTSLIVYERCPMKYYFQNIISLEAGTLMGNQPIAVSHAKRGIQIHKVIQRFLLGEIDFETSLDQIDQKAGEYFSEMAILWKNHIKNSVVVEVEKELRFSWKGNIILGTPDLYFIKENEIHIWDFKTGSVDDSDLEVYKLQLKWYAVAIQQQTRLSSSSIKFKIIALDLKKTFEFVIQSEQLEKDLNSWWSNFSDYTTKKLEHCPKCVYQVYCNKNL